MPADWLSGIYLKMGGAAAGSGIATAHHYDRDAKMISAIRFFSGFWFGTMGADRALIWLGWELTDSNRLFVSSVIGLGAFILVQILLANKTKAVIQKALEKRIGKAAE